MVRFPIKGSGKDTFVEVILWPIPVGIVLAWAITSTMIWSAQVTAYFFNITTVRSVEECVLISFSFWLAFAILMILLIYFSLCDKR